MQSFRNIGFISTRIAGTDGVSLEIEKWRQVLERTGRYCYYFAGELDRDAGSSYRVVEAHFEHPEIRDINKKLFGRRQRSRKISEKVATMKDHLKDKLYRFQKKYDIDLIIPENALTIPMNIPLGLALTEFIAETGIATIAHHHDFYWERDRFLINACGDYLNTAFPPDLRSIRHVVINSLASQQLSHRLGISNTIIPNVYDFAGNPAKVKNRQQIRSELGFGPDDVLVLQPTRIVARKWIERSIEIVRNLQLPKPRLVISHASGDEVGDYFDRIREYARNMEVQLVLIDHLIGSHENHKKYTIGDIYQCADLVTYPSGYEGFGNAFLEAIYYRKPIVVNRYSIYIADIEPQGFDVVTLDGFVTRKAIRRIHRILQDEELRRKTVDKNFELAKQFFSYGILEKRLTYLMNSFE